MNVWSFGGGKGGVGKSLICASLGIELAKRGRRVIALDADLGAANLHTLLGVARPAKTLGDFFAASEGADLNHFVVETEIEGLGLISGAASILQDAHPRPVEKRRLAEALLRLDAHTALIDLGAGTHYNTLDFFNFSGRGVVVTGPEPTSIQNAYAFLKAALFRAFERRLSGARWVSRLLDRAIKPTAVGRVDSVERLFASFEAEAPEVRALAEMLLEALPARLVLNQTKDKEERKILSALGLVCRRYLSLEPPHLSTIPEDPEVARLIRRMRPVASPPGSHFHYGIQRLLDALLLDPGAPRLEMLEAPTPSPAPPPSARPSDAISAPKQAFDEAEIERLKASLLALGARAAAEADEAPEPPPPPPEPIEGLGALPERRASTGETLVKLPEPRPGGLDALRDQFDQARAVSEADVSPEPAEEAPEPAEEAPEPGKAVSEPAEETPEPGAEVAEPVANVSKPAAEAPEAAEEAPEPGMKEAPSPSGALLEAPPLNLEAPSEGEGTSMSIEELFEVAEESASGVHGLLDLDEDSAEGSIHDIAESPSTPEPRPATLSSAPPVHTLEPTRIVEDIPADAFEPSEAPEAPPLEPTRSVEDIPASAFEPSEAPPSIFEWPQPSSNAPPPGEAEPSASRADDAEAPISAVERSLPVGEMSLQGVEPEMAEVSARFQPQATSTRDPAPRAGLLSAPPPAGDLRALLDSEEDPYADFDPWGDLSLSGAPEPTEVLDDPPAHEVVRVEGWVSTPQGRAYASVSDMAPDAPELCLMLIVGETRAEAHERYDQLLGGHPQQIAVRARALHAELVAALKRGEAPRQILSRYS